MHSHSYRKHVPVVFAWNRSLGKGWKPIYWKLSKYSLDGFPINEKNFVRLKTLKIPRIPTSFRQEFRKKQLKSKKRRRKKIVKVCWHFLSKAIWRVFFCQEKLQNSNFLNLFGHQVGYRQAYVPSGLSWPSRFFLFQRLNSRFIVPNGRHLSTKHDGGKKGEKQSFKHQK